MDSTTLLEALRRSISEELAGKRAVAVAYSGGLDSSVIAMLAATAAEVKCYSCVVEGSFDDKHVRSDAHEDNMELEVITLGQSAIRRYVAVVSSVIDSSDPTRIGYTIPIVAVVRESEESTVLAGSGADELFGGYAKYTSMEDPSVVMTADLRKILVESAQLRRYAASQGKELILPFLGTEIVEIASKVPLKHKLNATERKLILREAARKLGLRAHDRPKKAAQYSSGVLKEMERLARRDGLRVGEWVDRTIRESRATP